MHTGVSLGRGEGITHSGVQERLRCFHTFIFSKVSSEGIDLATYLSFLFNMRTGLFFCPPLVFPQSRGLLAPGSTSPKGCDLILGCQRSLYTSLSCCYVVGVFCLLFRFICFLQENKKKKKRGGSRVSPSPQTCNLRQKPSLSLALLFPLCQLKYWFSQDGLMIFLLTQTMGGN